MINYKSLENTSIETIHETFLDAFSNYQIPFQLELWQLQHMLGRRGCQLEFSFGAFHNDQLVGFILNGIDQWNGKLTAYDTGTGIIPSYQGKGISKQLFKACLKPLKEQGVEQYLLEVLKENTKAFQLYKKTGFEVCNHFDFYVTPKESFEFNVPSLGNDFSIRPISTINWELMKSFWDIPTSWQNSVNSIRRKRNDFIILGVYLHEELIGYGIIETKTGDLPQLAIKKEFRRKRLATHLVNQLLSQTEKDTIRIINVKADYQPFKKFGESLKLKAGAGQYEMIMTL